MNINETNHDEVPEGAVFGREPSGRAGTHVLDLTGEHEVADPTTEPGAVEPDDDTEPIALDPADLGERPEPAEAEEAGHAEAEEADEPVDRDTGADPPAAADDLPEAAEPEPAVEEALAGDEQEERWDAAKVGFVDEPRQAVERAAELVNEALSRLEERWRDGDDTEALRVAFQHYRAVFDAVRSQPGRS
jgi:hypothetical protein